MIFYFFLSLQAAFALGSPDPALLMNTSEIPEFSCSVELINANTLEHFSSCSGALIAGNSVLTAEHCLILTEMYRANGNPIAYRIQCGGEEQVSNMAIGYRNDHRTYSSDGAFDNLIVKLEKPFKNVDPAELPETSKGVQNILLENNKCFASGYGYDLNMTSKAHRGVWINTSGANVFTRPGDSGGEAYCMHGGRYFVIGLLRKSEMDFSKPTSIEPITPALSWMRSLVKAF